MFLRKSLLFIFVVLTASWAWAQEPPSIGSINYNSSLEAYEINTANKLKDLAVYVNGSGTYSTGGSETTAHDCAGLVFKLTTDISIDYTTEWNSESTEHNFNAIGSIYSYNIRFCGTFDGQDHTISGIRIYHSGNNQEKGLFGAIGDNGHVLNLKLSNTRITCQHQVGAIAGYSSGEVAGCTVMDDVAVHTVSTGSRSHGGVVGYNAGSVTGCVCSATLTVADNVTNCMYFGGIVGQGGTLQGNRAFGVTIANVANYKGAIIGNAGNSVTLTNNGYALCTVGGSTTAIGCNGADVTANNGAVPMSTVAGTNITVSTTPSYVHNYTTNYYLAGTTITVSYTGTIPDDYYYLTYSATDAQSNPVSVTGNTFTMPSSDATVVASVITPVWSGSGTQNDPYVITSVHELNMLSYRVNNNKSNSNNEAYSSLHYRLNGDITYTHTTDWDNVPSTENNFTAIGTASNSFRGFFDGANHTVSGIRIRVLSAEEASYNQGLFGYVSGGTVENLLLADTRITGYWYAGGIVGTNDGGTIQNCHVLDNVDIHIAFTQSRYYGGIAGRNMGSTGNINNCSSSATLSFRGIVDVSYSRGLGGIVGYHTNQGTVSNCLSLNARVIRKDIDGTLRELSGVKHCGAVVGQNDRSNGLSNNYYRNFTVGGNEATYGSGNESGGTDVTSNRGAVRGYFITYGENAGSNALTIPAHGSTAEQSHHVAASGQSVQALYTGGESNKTLLVSYDGMVIPIVVTPNSSFSMPATDATITATNDWSGSGTSGDPYIIESPEQLNMLSFRVNNGVSNYDGKYFQLAGDITYSHTTDWDDATSTENNYVTIGITTTTKYFKGTLDGQNHTISGIRVYKDDNSSYHGLFGYVNGALVKNLILADTRITGCAHTAGIVGLLDGASEVTLCHVLGNVTIHAVTTQSDCHGGVVGTNGGNVNHCSSAATLTKLQNAYGCNAWGGIVGYTSAAGASVNDNYAYGVTITNVASTDQNVYPISNVGAIAGDKTAGIHRNNYYHNCNVIGNTSNIGLNGADLTNDDGAVPAYFLTYVGNASAGATSITIPAHDANAEQTYNIAGAGRSVQALYSGSDENFEAVLTVTQDGTDPAVTTDVIENEYFTMPAGDVTIALKNYNFIKNIEPNRWYAIASPMHDENQTYESIANVTNLATGAYDLFRYSESNRTWENHKKHNDGNGATDNTFTTLAIGSGYIYRNGSEQTLHFTGEPNNEATYSITLSATGSGELKGFNLIGNPYPSALPFSRDHYSLNADGSWTAHTDGNGTIAAGEAVLVHTETNGETITVSPAGIVDGSSKGTLPPLPKALCLNEDENPSQQFNNSTDQQPFAYRQGNNIIIAGTGTLQVFDALGRRVLSKEITTHSTQLSALNFRSGVYLFLLGTKTQKVIF